MLFQTVSILLLSTSQAAPVHLTTFYIQKSSPRQPFSPPVFVKEEPEVILGEGAYGKVYRARLQGTHINVALKVQGLGAVTKRESEIQRMINSPYVVKLMGYTFNSVYPYYVDGIALELVNGEDIHEFIYGNQRNADWRVKWRMCKELTIGLLDMHNQGN